MRPFLLVLLLAGCPSTDDTASPDAGTDTATDTGNATDVGTDSWGEVDHSVFPLVGGHAIDCAGCHDAPPADALDPTCLSCHPWVADTGHVNVPHDQPCNDCHTIYGWF